MLNFLINFSIIVFICYAVRWPVKAILFGGKESKPARRQKPARAMQRKDVRPRKKQAKIIRLPSREKTARKNLRAA